MFLALNVNTSVDFLHLKYFPLPRKPLDWRQMPQAPWLLSLSGFPHTWKRGPRAVCKVGQEG